MTPHPVQTTPDDWHPPARYAGFAVLETVSLPLEYGQPYRTITLLRASCGHIVAVDYWSKVDVSLS